MPNKIVYSKYRTFPYLQIGRIILFLRFYSIHFEFDKMQISWIEYTYRSYSIQFCLATVEVCVFSADFGWRFFIFILLGEEKENEMSEIQKRKCSGSL